MTKKNIRIQNTPAQVYWSKKWSSPKGVTKTSSRTRKSHRQYLGDFMQAEVEPKDFFSISHTEDLGALGICRQPIGIDVEQKTRVVSAAVQKRLGSDKELAAFPLPIQLWVAKEAAWKAFRDYPKYKQPKVIADIYIERVLKNGTFYFSVPNSSYKNNIFTGRIYSLKKHYIAACVLTH